MKNLGSLFRINLNNIKSKLKILDKVTIISIIKPYYIGFLIFLILISSYHIIFAKRLIPGVRIAGLRLGGLTYNSAVNRLIDYEKMNEKKIKFVGDGKEYLLTSEEIDLNYNWEASVNRAFEVGRTGNFWVDTKDKIAGIFKSLYIPAFYGFDDGKFSNFLAGVKGELNVPAKNAFYYIKDRDKLAVQEESTGKQIDEQNLYESIIKAFDNYNFKDQQIVIEEKRPEVKSEDISTHLAQAEKIIFTPITIVYEKNRWPLTYDQKLEFLLYDPVENVLEVNKANFRTFLEGISPSVNKLPRGRATADADNKVTSFELIQDGIELDIDATTQNFKKSFFSNLSEADVKTAIITGPNVTAKDYGIYALLGEGKSKYSGSATGRIHNLTLAAQRTDGALVPPGSVYSFNDAVGDVSAATGYDAAWVILGSRTVLGHGGGVCQTSTTMFRAALNAGLPIITRHPHAYRVRYYEIESPVGIDASVYQPSLDLEFKNDTPNYILIQLFQNPEEEMLSFKIFGTPDGRKVEMTEPVILSQSGPPATLYQDDPTLPKGTVKQIDFAAGGANVSFTRKVTKNDEVLYNDTFKTNYQPWRAIYLVGTKE